MMKIIVGIVVFLFIGFTILRGRYFYMLQQDVQQFKALEQNERAMYEQLLLISELKRIYISRHLKR